MANACAAVGWGYAWRAVSGELPFGLSFDGDPAVPSTKVTEVANTLCVGASAAGGEEDEVGEAGIDPP